MKDLKKNLQSISKDIKKLTGKIEKLVADVEKKDKPKAKTVKAKPVKKALAKKAAPVKKAPAKKAAPKKKEQGTAFDAVISIIRRRKRGVSAGQIKEKTGFDDKKIANIVYKAKKNGLIKSEIKGVYVKV